MEMNFGVDDRDEFQWLKTSCDHVFVQRESWLGTFAWVQHTD